MEYVCQPLTDAEKKAVRQKITESEKAIAPPQAGAAEERLIFKILDDEGAIIAGCIAAVDVWKALYIDILWVDERFRRCRLGSLLLRRAERAGRERGCHLAYLGTFRFQARGFYEKQGYTLFNDTPDFPRGQASYALFKRLDTAENAAEENAAFRVLTGDPADAAFIDQMMDEYNAVRAPHLHPYVQLSRKLVDADGNMIAACIAGLDGWNVAHIHGVWVEEGFRGQKLASALVRQAEQEAKEQGGYLVTMYAFDWQAGFFRKQGYIETGVLQDWPRGHTWHLMCKKL